MGGAALAKSGNTPGTSLLIQTALDRRIACAQILEVTHHLALSVGRRVRDGSGGAGAPKSASTVERDGSLIVGSDPKNEPSLSMVARPAGDPLDKG
jgi:hypothetical protein